MIIEPQAAPAVDLLGTPKRVNTQQNTPTLHFSELEIQRSLTRQSFIDFLREHWAIVCQEEFIENWHIEYLCNELQEIAERVFRKEPKKYDLVINISPGSTKSTIASIMFPAWVWTRMSHARMICGSYSHPLAMDLSRRSRDVIKSDLYRSEFPEIVMREDQDTKSYFANSLGGTRYAVGTGGSVTGMHGHFLIVDDPLDPLEAISEVELKTANRWMSETLSTRKIAKEITPTILIMQRLHQDDPTQMMLNRKTPVKHISIPAEIDGKNPKNLSPVELAKYYTKGLMDPVRLSRSVLQASKEDLGEYGYAGQFMQNPIPLGGGMFKTELLHVLTPPTQWVIRMRFWDKAGTPTGKGAYTVGCLMGRDIHGRIWVLDVKRGRWSSGDREKVIKDTADMDGRTVLVGLEQEPGSGGKESAENTTKALSGYRVRIDRPTGDKVLRADPFSVQVNVGNVYLAPGPWNADYVTEMSYFPYSTHKDQIDASSGAFSFVGKAKTRVGGLKRGK
jgi:predicted phage terminase large subunit-like protein